MSAIRYIALRALVALLLAGFTFPGEASAQRGASVLDAPDVQREAQRGLDLLYDMQFEEAERIFEQIDREHPKHPIGPFLLALNTWWEILIDLSDTAHDDEFFDEMKEVIKRSERLLKRDRNNFDAAFFKGAALGFRGRLRSNRGDWFKAAMDGKNAMKYVLQVAEKDPKNDDYVFGKGIYDYYADVIPDRHPFVKPVMVFFPNGDRERGLKLLQRTAEKGRFIQTEAAYFLAQIYYIYERDLVKTSEYVDWLRREHPNNSFFHTLEGRVLARRGRWEEAREVFGEVISRGTRKSRPATTPPLPSRRSTTPPAPTWFTATTSPRSTTSSNSKPSPPAPTKKRTLRYSDVCARGWPTTPSASAISPSPSTARCCR